MAKTCEDNKLGDLLTYALMAFVLFALVAFLIKSGKQEIQADVQEAMEIANVVEVLPEIVIPDPILPRALPPLIEGGEVYFEEL